MATIRPKKVEARDRGITKRELYATVCYYYPQYNLKQVQNMTYRDVKLLLDTARKQQAAYLHNLTLIAQAPHSRKQQNVKKLVDYFKKLAGK